MIIFRSDRMLIQRYVCPTDGRHIEIQIIGDKHGNYVTFPERECSLQRRKQKVVEESPSPLFSGQVRFCIPQHPHSTHGDDPLTHALTLYVLLLLLPFRFSLAARSGVPRCRRRRCSSAVLWGITPQARLSFSPMTT